MHISSTRLTAPSTSPKAQTAPPSNESLSFLNEPHIPMDAVMRGYQDLDLSGMKDVLGFAAIGAAGGALAGAATGGSGWMVPTTVGTTAAALTAATAADLAINGDDGYGGLALLASPIAGGGIGLAGGIAGFGLTALTGLNPVASGAIAGGIAGAAISMFSE